MAAPGRGPDARHAHRSAPELVLASRSPQRRAILEQLGVRFVVRSASVEELRAGDPETVARENAARKARAVADLGGPGRTTVLAADTVVALDGRLYGKPPGPAEARATLEALDGRVHEVLTGVCVLDAESCRLGASRTRVRFRPLSVRELDWYLATGEWRERAGAYAIQGAGAALVEAIEGDYSGVVGLPVPVVLALLPNLLEPSG